MRLIDADALKEEVNKKKVVGRFNTLSLIDNAPTVIWCSETSEGYPLMDLRPREKAEWIKCNFKTFGAFGDWEYKCSNCEKVYGGEYNFCPNCGALMKGGAE